MTHSCSDNTSILINFTCLKVILTVQAAIKTKSRILFHQILVNMRNSLKKGLFIFDKCLSFNKSPFSEALFVVSMTVCLYSDCFFASDYKSLTFLTIKTMRSINLNHAFFTDELLYILSYFASW